ncbi:hypothetical protein RvY_16441-1 [Ramazzottius varieornatus]|uniref:GST C-terminal domain-containing protein n=1 Tax=Ramazzottius varieornatus TaxID=947166 RepID=A0A1D1VYF8_RAMVA|nr:hypothetical protein RvY_16441-1 [Ramazzottius varieornatus]
MEKFRELDHWLSKHRFLTGDNLNYTDFLLFETLNNHNACMPDLLEPFVNLQRFHKEVMVRFDFFLHNTIPHTPGHFPHRARRASRSSLRRNEIRALFVHLWRPGKPAQYSLALANVIVADLPQLVLSAKVATFTLMHTESRVLIVRPAPKYQWSLSSSPSSCPFPIF